MVERVVVGNLGSSNFGLQVSKEGQNVLSTSAQNLVFDSTKSRTGQIYAGGSTSSTSGTITWTSGSKATLTYIPMYLIFEQDTNVLHEFDTNVNPDEAYDFFQINNQAFAWELSNTSITPVTTYENGWIGRDTGYALGSYNILSDDSFALFYSTRTSNATTFLVLRIPCAYGFMGNTYVDASGTSQTFGSTNHPTFGDSESLWT